MLWSFKEIVYRFSVFAWQVSKLQHASKQTLISCYAQCLWGGWEIIKGNSVWHINMCKRFWFVFANNIFAFSHKIFLLNYFLNIWHLMLSLKQLGSTYDPQLAESTNVLKCHYKFYWFSTPISSTLRVWDVISNSQKDINLSHTRRLQLFWYHAKSIYCNTLIS